MSVFKSFSKVISQATLNSQAKTYILSQRYGVQNPVLYYLNQPTPPQDIFQVSLISYHLARKNEVNRNLLQQLEGSTPESTNSLSDYRNTLSTQAEKENRLAEEYVTQLTSLLNSGMTDLPIDNAVKALYAYEATNRSDVALYEKYLFPVIRSKLAYASLNNLIELTTVLSNIKYFEDKALWEGIVKRLGEKFDRPSPKYVRNTGWELNAYEEDEGPARSKFTTDAERHYADIKESGNVLGNLKNEIRNVWNQIQGRFIYRLFFNEGTLSGVTESFPEVVDKEKLRTGLEGARNAGINVEDVIGRLRLK